MGKRRASPRGINRHRNYTVDEVARKLKVADGTVRRWLKAGLRAVTDRKPLLILGDDLKDFLDGRKAVKQRCKLQECFCFTCRAPREPAGKMAEFRPLSATSGNLGALCCSCLGAMHKRVSMTRLGELQAMLDLTIMQAG